MTDVTLGEPLAKPARLPGFDVVRGIALIGVVVMNYHGYLNGGNGGAPDPFLGTLVAPYDRWFHYRLGELLSRPDPPSWAERLFNPFEGVLSTRFAATFVMVAGVGVVLLTNRSRLSGDREARREDRWRLIRRGVLLLAFGFTLNWIWNGTILFFYGAFFIVAALIFTWRIRWLALFGGFGALAAYAIQVQQIHLQWTGGNLSWWYSSAYDRSYKGLLLDVFVNGTHPLFPWLAFFCTGMIIGRLIPHLAVYRRRLVGWGLAALVIGYVGATLIRRATDAPTTELQAQIAALARTDPFSRMPLYVVTTWGSSVVAVLGIAWLGDRYARTSVVDALRRAGQMTLSLYVLHVLVFDGFVNDLHWVRHTGLDTALLFAVAFWAFAILLGAWWNRFVGRGPLEVLYRRFGG